MTNLTTLIERVEAASEGDQFDADAWGRRWVANGGTLYRASNGEFRFAVLNHMDDDAEMRRSRRAVLLPLLRPLNASQRAASLRALQEKDHPHA